MGIDDVITRVERAGDANRKTLAPTSKWLPKPNSPLWGVYARYCEARGQKIKAKVGRCHFWHVILFLAPLRWVLSYLSRPTQMSFPAVLLLLAIVAGVECLLGLVFDNWWGLPITVAGIAGVAGVIGGLVAYMVMNSDDDYGIGDIVEEIIGDEKFSWGAIALLLCGPAVLVGLLIGFFIHCIAKVCGWIMDRVGDGIVKTFRITALVVMVVVCVGGVSWLVYEFFVSFGWAATGGAVAIIALVGGLAWHFHPQIDDFVEAGGDRWKARQQRIWAETVASGTPRRPSRIRRIGRSIVTAFCLVRDLFRLAFTAVVYGYKQICDLAPVPEHLLKREEEVATV